MKNNLMTSKGRKEGVWMAEMILFSMFWGKFLGLNQFYKNKKELVL
jgi:hypothetical protein